MMIFFFQGEDGIRDSSVTGVQTCALPILRRIRRIPPCSASPRRTFSTLSKATLRFWPACPHLRVWRRSEEHTSELQSHLNLVCRLLLEKKKQEPTPKRSAHSPPTRRPTMPTRAACH